MVSDTRARILHNVKVTMRDGARLATTVCLPTGSGPFSVVLVRTAYNRIPGAGDEFTERGIAFVTQDVRGRYDSEGEFYPFINEERDGADTLDWIAAQPWCNGRVAMYGDSYLAATSFYAALSGHPNLVTINPRFMAGDCWKRAYYADGAFSLGLTWSWLCFECGARVSHAGLMPKFDVPAILRSLPIVEMDEASGAGAVQSYRDYATGCRYGPQWEATNVRARFDEVRVPTLLVGGWYDYYAGETFANLAALRERGAAQVRDSHRVLIGPWTHGITANPPRGDVDFGPPAFAENDCTARWLECMLAGRPAEEFQQAPIRLFVMGANVWRAEYEWPLARTQWVSYYLRSGGCLAPEPPGDEVPDQYDYDPDDPVPTLGGNHSIGPYNPGLYEMAKPGPYDQGPVEARDDVLVYTSAALDRDLEVTGPVSVTLFASSSAPDTDFVTRLVDVYPDGRAMNITEGVIRARFRDGVWGEPRLMEPGRDYEFTIDLQATSNLFRAGHRIRLQITSSCFPLWDRNLNTGNDPATDTEMRVAHQTVRHDRLRPSRVVLPIANA
jgi:putative CocE/NonD family hydrolase